MPGGPATVAANTLAHGCGGLNVDACRVGEAWENRSAGQGAGRGTANDNGSAYGKGLGGVVAEPHPAGRWPTNVVLAHAPELDPVTGEVIGDACADGCVPGCHVAALDEQSEGTRAAKPAKSGSAGRPGAVYNRPVGSEPVDYGDSGGASRFYPTFRYTAKAGKRERPQVWAASCECHVEPVDSTWGIKLAQWCRIAECGECGARAKLTGHPTVKPLGLWRWLTDLLVPPGGAMIDMFAGSGTAGQVAEQVGARAILIEADEPSVRMIHERMFRARHRRPSGLNAP